MSRMPSVFEGTDFLLGIYDSGELFKVEGVCGDEVPSEDVGLDGSSSGHEVR